MQVLKAIFRIRFIFFILFVTSTLPVQAAFTPSSEESTQTGTRKLIQWGAEESNMNRKTHLVELRGNAYVFRDNEEIHADEIDLNNETEYVKARGRVRYQYGTYFIRADSIEIDLKSKTGTVLNGNISNGLFSLRGSRMDQVEPNHFLIKDYDYSTCIDCPNSWELSGKEVDLTLEGYAYMKDFVFKAYDTDLIWLPYMVIPVKTKRQSGFLFPRFGLGGVYGAFLVSHYFYAINDWSDMTIGAGYYSQKGSRFEWEGRYALTKQSEGQFNLFWTRDTEVRNLTYRYAIKGKVTQELPFHFEGKLRLNEVSDSGYPIAYADDISGRYEPVLTSDLFFTRNDPQLSTVISFKRIRNLLEFDPYDNKKFLNGFDGKTVQEIPRVMINSNDHFFLNDRVAFGVDTRFNRFRRAAGPFDDFVYKGAVVQTVREADRFTFIPSLYTTVNPWPWLSLVPSVQYRSFYYTFNSVPNTGTSQRYPDLARGYLLAQAEMSFQLEKVYPSENPNVTYKHLIRPTFTYSKIPTVQQSSTHPFIEQVQNQGRPGQYFDNSDIVPYGTTQNLETYFTPLGNSLTYGLLTQVFKKEKEVTGDTKVSRRFEAGLTQTLDIREAQRTIAEDQADSRVILSPLFSHFIYTDAKFSANLDYTYYSYLDRYQDTQLANLLKTASPHRLNASIGWTIENKVKDGLLRFDRSVALSYVFSKLTSRVSSLDAGARFSINDYIMPKGGVTYNMVQNDSRVLGANGGFLFQSPSRCWQLDFLYTYSVDGNSGPTVNFALNFDGNSFGSLQDPLKK